MISTKFQIISKAPNYKQNRIGYSKLEFEIYLRFGICNLEFGTLYAMPYALCVILVEPKTCEANHGLGLRCKGLAVFQKLAFLCLQELEH